jgi:hypothetical protein
VLGHAHRAGHVGFAGVRRGELPSRRWVVVSTLVHAHAPSWRSRPRSPSCATAGVVAQRGMVVLCIAFVPVRVPLRRASSMRACGGGGVARFHCASLTSRSLSRAQMFVVWTHVEWVAVVLHQPPLVAKLAQRYMRVLIAGALPYFTFETLRRFLQSQQIVRPMFLATCVADVAHPGLCWLLAHGLGWGLEGIAAATVVSYTVMLLYLLAYMARYRPHHPGTWGGFSLEAFSELGQYLGLAIPGTTHVPCAVVAVTLKRLATRRRHCRSIVWVMSPQAPSWSSWSGVHSRPLASARACLASRASLRTSSARASSRSCIDCPRASPCPRASWWATFWVPDTP